MTGLRVLLMSPVAGLDPSNGDVTYTEQLVAEPPPGVVYTTYDEALREGSVRDRFRRGHSSVSLLPQDRTAIGFAEVALNKGRRTGLFFREQFRHLFVRPGRFDLVHAHVFSVRLWSEEQLPLVMSNSVQTHALYRDGFGHRGSVTLLRALAERAAARSLGVTHAAYGQRGANAVVCFSDHLRQTFLAGPHEAYAQYVVVPPGVEVPSDSVIESRAAGDEIRVGFVGDWVGKGGDTVLAAYLQLRAAGHQVSLTVVGGRARMSATESSRLGITWLPRAPREALLHEIIPTFDVFAYPSRFDGLPLTLLEVMAAGVPVIVSDYGALPEVVDFGRAGLVVRRGDIRGLATAISALLEPDTRRLLGTAARERVRSNYEIRRAARALGRVYADVAERAGSVAEVDG